MKSSLPFTLFIILALLFVPALYAKDDTKPDIASRYEKYHIEYHLNDDGSYNEVREYAKTVLKERAIESLKDASISYSASIEKIEIISAYTRKADGRRIDVPKDNFQIVENKGKGKDAPVYSDRVAMTLVFPELAVGDTVVLAYRITAKEPMFPNEFSVSSTFSRSYPYDDVDIKFDYPKNLWVQYEARGMSQKVSEKEGRKVLELHFENHDPVKNERQNYSVFDVEKATGYAFSTFHSYKEIAEAYGVRALPKTKVTERVQKLADEVIGDKKDKRDQARALYEWVATNITYAGNCIGIGAVVPHDVDFILDNRMGDCKDHATLLQTLLAAKGIKSIQVLINAGSVYKLPDIPVVSTVNHVINYIPSMDLYLDSTASTIPFGMLPFSDSGKPVMWVENYRDGTRTPVPPVGNDRQIMKSSIKVNDDGSISGSVNVSLKGLFAVWMRSSLRNMSKDAEKDIVKNVFKEQGRIGNGQFEMEDAKPLLDRYSYKATFNVKDFINRPGAGAFYVQPIIFSMSPVSHFTQSAIEQTEKVDVACHSAYSREEYKYTFPKGMKILAVPHNVVLKNDFLSYKATYSLKGRVLTVTREMDDRTKGNICSPAIQKAYQSFAKKMANDLRAQIVYM